MPNIEYARHGSRWTSTFSPDTDWYYRTETRWFGQWHESWERWAPIRDVWLSNLEFHNRIAIDFVNLLDGRSGSKDYNVYRDFRAYYGGGDIVIPRKERGATNDTVDKRFSVGGTLVAEDKRIRLVFEGEKYVTATVHDSSVSYAHSSNIFGIYGNNNYLELTFQENFHVVTTDTSDYNDAQLALVRINGNNNHVKIRIRRGKEITATRWGKARMENGVLVPVNSFQQGQEFYTIPLGRDRTNPNMVGWDDIRRRAGHKRTFLDYVVSIGNNNRLEIEYFD